MDGTMQRGASMLCANHVKLMRRCRGCWHERWCDALEDQRCAARRGAGGCAVELCKFEFVVKFCEGVELRINLKDETEK